MLRNNKEIGFPRLWTVAGYLLLALVAIFVGRIVYEETVLTWTHGPQMIGFAMVHTMPFMLLAGFIGLVGGLLWMLVSNVVVSKAIPNPIVRLAPTVLSPSPRRDALYSVRDLGRADGADTRPEYAWRRVPGAGSWRR